MLVDADIYSGRALKLFSMRVLPAALGSDNVVKVSTTSQTHKALAEMLKC